MTGDPLQRFVAGEALGTLRADTMNALVDAAKQVRRERSRGLNGASVAGYGGEPPYLEILIRNDTGADLPLWGIVRPADPIQDPVAYPFDVADRPYLQGLAPTAGGVFAVAMDTIPEDEIGRAVILGVALVNLSVTATGDTHASCTTATDKLTTSTAGTCKILWKQSGTGDKLGLVLLQRTDSVLSTQNVDATALDATTDDVRADQSTHIKFQTTGGYQRLYLDITELAEDTDFTDALIDAGALLTFTVPVDVVTCVDFVNSTVKKTRITMLTGTVVDTARCVEAEECCPDLDIPCCDGFPIPQLLTVTISGGGGDYPASWDGSQWDTGLITITGCGTARLTLACDGTTATDFGVGNGDVSAACQWSTTLASEVGDCDPTFTFSVDGTFSGGSCSCTTKTLTWSVPA